MSVTARQQALIDDLAVIEDRQERLSVVVDRSRASARLSDAERSDAHLVPGCTSRVWLLGRCDAGRCTFRFDCDSPLVKGLVGLLVESYQDATPEEVVGTEPRVLSELGLLRDLSPTRQNGLAAVRRRLVELAGQWT